MFSATFLGHQGWVFQSDQVCLLVDPLLQEEFGQAHALEYRVFPPRVLKPEVFPRVDALILTHEHDDHFDVPSLAQLDRRIPVFLSSRSSMGAYKFLCDMGFQVHPLVPGLAIRIGDLEVLPLCGDHVSTNCGDEWDTLPILISHTGGDGSFFSTIDVTLTARHMEWVRQRVPRPGLVTWTNNALDWSHMANYLTDRGDSTPAGTQRMQAGHAMITSMWGTPSAMLTCAGGFSFQGARAWLNRRVFCVDMERACKAMTASFPNERFYAPRPGQTFHMKDNVIVRVDKQAPFLSTTPPDSWPLRTRVERKELPDYEPATGRREITAEEVPLLLDRLTEFAEALVGGALFKGLHSLLHGEAGERFSTFAFVLRSGEEREAMVFEYNPNLCSFEPSGADSPRDAYLAGMECWATDLLAVLSGELGPIALNFGRAWLWNALPQRFSFSLFPELHRVSHPLRRPAQYYALYQRLLSGCGAGEPKIRPRSS